MSEQDVRLFLAQFDKARENIKTWPQWMQDAAYEAAATFPRAAVIQNTAVDERMAAQNSESVDGYVQGADGATGTPAPGLRWQTELLEMIENYGRERNNAGISLGSYDKGGARQADREAEDTLAEIRAHIAAAGVAACDAMPDKLEMPSTDASETVSAIYRALSRGNNRDAQALAQHYLSTKHAAARAAGVPACDGGQP